MSKWTEDSIVETLQKNDLNFNERNIQNGKQFILPENTKICFYPTTGKVLIQGKSCPEKELLEKERTLLIKEALIEKEIKLAELSKVELELKEKTIEEKEKQIMEEEAKRTEEKLKEMEEKESESN